METNNELKERSSRRQSHRFSIEDFSNLKASMFRSTKRVTKTGVEIPRLKLPIRTTAGKGLYGTVSYTVSNKENNNSNIAQDKKEGKESQSSIQLGKKFKSLLGKILFPARKARLLRSQSQAWSQPQSKLVPRSCSMDLVNDEDHNGKECIHNTMLSEYLARNRVKQHLCSSQALFFGNQSKAKIRNTRYLQSISGSISINDLTKSLKMSKPPLPEALSHRSMSPNDDTTPRFTDGARTDFRNSRVNFAASEVCETQHVDYELEAVMNSKILPKTLRQIRPDLRASLVENSNARGSLPNDKEKLWKYIFELQKQVMDLQVKLKESKEESVLGVSMCSRIKDEAAIIKQDLEHQIEELTMEVSEKDLEIARLTRCVVDAKRGEEMGADDYGLELRGNLSPRYLKKNYKICKEPENEAYYPQTNQKKQIISAKPRINDTIDISFEMPAVNDNKSMLMHMDTSNVSEILPDNTSQLLPGTTHVLYDALHKLSAPSMDLKILLSKTDEEKDSPKDHSMLKELNTALQTHIRQLLDEKREMAELAKRNAETADEERRLLEARMQELSTEVEVSRVQRTTIESEELGELRRLKEMIEEEKRTLRHKKSAFNKKLAKMKDIQEQLTKKEEALKELDIKMRIKQKKLYFKKQALEKEWKSLDEQRGKIASDIKDIDYEWSSVMNLKEKLFATGKKIADIKRQLKEQHESIERKENELDKTLSEYKSQLLTKEELEKKNNKLKEKEEALLEQENNLKKDREGVVTMRLKMNEELRQINMQRRILENLKSELDTLQGTNN